MSNIASQGLTQDYDKNELLHRCKAHRHEKLNVPRWQDAKAFPNGYDRCIKQNAQYTKLGSWHHSINDHCKYGVNFVLSVLLK